jgi:uncharacterized protein (TIGR02271 family)
MKPTDQPDGEAPADAIAAAPAAPAAPAAVERSLPVIEERVRVDKVAVDQGGFRVSKRVEMREDVVDEELLRDEVRIERRPIGEPLPPGSAPVPHHDGDTLVIPVLRETLVVEKRLFLVEEVRITRTAVRDRVQQPVTLRAEEITIERLDAGEGRSHRSEAREAGNPGPPGAFSKER